MLVAVDEGLVKVEDEGWLEGWRQPFGDGLWRHWSICILDEVENVEGGSEMVLAELVKTRRLAIRVSVNECTDIIPLKFRLLTADFVRFEQIGLRSALYECSWGLACESCHVFVEDAIRLLSFQLESLFSS